jgi:hypothetical protein
MITVSELSKRIRVVSLILFSLALASCRSSDTEVQQIPPVKTADTTFGASPNPIVVTDGSKLGLTTLSWTTTKTKQVEIRVTGPSGPVMATVGASGSTDTGKWVKDGMQFYLQDASGPNKADASATLAVVTIKVIER